MSVPQEKGADLNSEHSNPSAASIDNPIENTPISNRGAASDKDVTQQDPESGNNTGHPAAVTSVPRLKRRGLFSQITIIPEVDNPRAYSRLTKWIITCIVSFSTLIAPLGTSIFYPALHQVESDLHTSSTVTNLSLAFYLLAMAIFPFWWMNWAVAFGRRNIYLVSFSLGVVFAVLAAISKSIGMLIAMRLMSGGCSASVQAVGVATITDLWEPRERGRAMGIFFLGPQLGPFLAPIIGGALANRWGWRSTMWFIVIIAAAMLTIQLLCLPETSRRDEKTWWQTTQERLSHHSAVSKTFIIPRMLIVDPFKALYILRYPVFFFPMAYIGIVTVYFYVLNISMEQTFAAPPYNFSTLVIGLCYIPSSLGYIVGSVIGGRWMDYVMMRSAKKSNQFDVNGKPQLNPEDRMQENAWLAGLIPVASLIWYGWTIQYKVFWLAPLIANFFTGFGLVVIISLNITMLTEFLPGDARPLSCSVLARNGVGCVGTVIGAPMLDSRLQNGWTFTIWAFVALACLPIIIIMRVFGPRWREALPNRKPNT
ncbi:major facilitator superfamily domain-containing protein [Talaromyces proteolyticus]|uniref:Major facilitator superfamily domain-containing protein n=1 Tax=Talaromyces proteolyticus TaxID=1131652 RepID=A0AAD4PWS8_9EURO|nr:major facilitator superfamily domain-containing protein [Talaromyces proteolyticus]KAH8691964.1 major facilitator superfamily domain-containing protein [Talaromyces proteolyticus]